jgi:inosose dehydratase
MAIKVRGGHRTLYDGVVDGMFVPLGDGDGDIAVIAAALNATGFDGWYVMEQGTQLRRTAALGGSMR